MARRISSQAGFTALHAYLDGDEAQIALAVRFTAAQLAQVHPGNCVEVRVPPWTAVQCVEGPVHTRGTPSNVVQMDAKTWLDLVLGRTDWASASSAGRIEASGTRSDLSEFFIPGQQAAWLAIEDM